MKHLPTTAAIATWSVAVLAAIAVTRNEDGAIVGLIGATLLACLATAIAVITHRQLRDLDN